MAGLGRPGNGWRSALLVGCLSSLMTSMVWAQFGPGMQFQGDLTPEESLQQRLPSEPRLLIGLGKARQQLDDKDYEAAIDTLQPLLETSEDFFQNVDDKRWVSSLAQVEKLLWEMPAEVIETYRRRYEPLAAQSLQTARSRSNLAELLSIVRNYPLTLSAAEATRAAADMAFDQGETALASGPERTTLLIRIAQGWTLAGQPEAATESVRELSTLAQASPIEYEKKLLTPPAMGDSKSDAAWLNKIFGPVAPLVPQRTGDWRMMGGHTRRWGSGALVSPIQRGSWAYPLIDQYDMFVAGRDAVFQSYLRDLDTRFQPKEPGSNVQPSLTPLVIGAPLVIGDTVVVQGLGSVKALDARTGHLRWSGVVKEDTFFYWAQRNFSEKGTNPEHDSRVEQYLSQRAWQNQAGSSLASDGQQVYAVSGTGMVGFARPTAMFMRNGMPQTPPRELLPPSDNRLLAYDLQTGLLKWESGGPAVAIPLDEDGQLTGQSRRMGGAFFLGAPLPVDGQLFVLAEDRGQIRLCSLSPVTGEVEWSLPLLNPSTAIANDETRRMFGLSPAYAGGLLICPTGEGVVVAVDPLLRRVEWFQQYRERSPAIDPRLAMRMNFQRPPQFGNGSSIVPLVPARRWLDSTPLLTAGRVLLPAADVEQLLCFDIETGKSLWQIPREEGLFIAACTERRCLIAGEQSLRSVQLSDGKGVWSVEIPTPSGRGVVSGGQYLLPVSTNEILAIDLKTGRILARSAIDPAHHAGSLVAAEGRLLMQTSSELIGFRPLSEVSIEIARDLNDPTTRARALSEQGEMQLFQGQESEAVASLQESLQLQESAPARQLLVWSLLERLKADYAGSRGLVAGLKQTITDPRQRRLLTQLNAEGLSRAGENLPAFQEYLELLQDLVRSGNSRGESLLELSANHQVREDRWLRGQLTQLYSVADESLRPQLKAALNEFLTAKEYSTKANFATVLGIDLAPELHLELARTNGADQFLTQRILWTFSESTDPQLRGPAVAKLIRNELSLKRTKFIAPLFSLLQHELASVECEPGITGADLWKLLREQFRLDRILGPQLDLLEQPLAAPSIALGQPSVTIHERMIYPVLGAKRGPFAEWLIAYDSNPNQLTHFCDPTGRSENPFNHESIPDSFLGPVRYVQTDPQLVLLAYRNAFAVISPMDIGRNQFQVRFHASLSQNQTRMPRQRNALPPKPGVRDVVYPAPGNTYAGNVGPLTYDTLCYLSDQNLFAVRPAANDGKVQWKRSGVPAGSEICADSQYVVMIPPLRDRLIVLRSADGVQVAERSFPKGAVERQRADWGRLFLVERTATAVAAPTETTTWAMYDPATDREVWSLSFPQGTLWTPADGADLTFLEPNGTLHLIDDQTGKVRWTAALPPPVIAPKSFTVHAETDRFFIHTAHARTPQQEEISEVSSVFTKRSVPVNGLVAALDCHSGNLLWSRPLEQQLFRPDLPAKSGVLAYAVDRRRPTPGKAGEQKTYTSFVFLSRQTGEPVFSTEVNEPTGTNEGWSRLPGGVMWLRISGQDFRLSWKKTDPEADAGEETDSEAPDQTEPIPENLPERKIKLE